MRARWLVSGVFVAVLVAMCGSKSVADRIDALRKSGARYVHSAPRPPGVTDEMALSGPDLASRLREDADGRALLDEGAAAVPELVRLLGDPARRTVAAVLLAEIGGRTAAEGLLDDWRGLRRTVTKECLYLVPDVGAPIGSRYENIDEVFYGQLLNALCYAGREVSSAIAGDTVAALAECERLVEKGVQLRRSEVRDEGGRRIEARWSLDPVETACEGVTILARSGAPEAPALMSRALKLQVRALRLAVIRSVAYLGERAEPLLPDLAPLLGDPKLRDETRENLALLVAGLSPAQRQAIARRYEARPGAFDDMR